MISEKAQAVATQIIRGDTEGEVLLVAQSYAGNPDDALKLIEEARRAIAAAADVDKVEELGKSKRRLEKIVRSTLASDPPVALRAQTELNRLFKLDEIAAKGAEDEDSGSESARELARAREHLETVVDMGDDYPVDELARIAAEKVRTATNDEGGG